MPPAPQPQISKIIAAQDHWYVSYLSGVDPTHNNHLVIAWVVLDDNVTVVPLIHSPDNQRDILQAQTIATDYVILNPYSQCPSCVRPPEPVTMVTPFKDDPQA